MNKILQKLKLVDILKLKFDVSKEKFISNVRQNISDELHFFMLDIFDKTQHNYYGEIKLDSIFIRKKITFSKPTKYGIAKGEISESKEETYLNLKIQSFHPIQKLILVFGILFFAFLLYFVFTKENGTGLLVIILPFFLLFFSYPIYQMRKNLKLFKKELETDLKLFNTA